MLELLIVLFLIVLNAFFAMSEMALMTSRKLRLKQLAETSRGARTALALAEHPDNLLSTVQVGITLIGVLTGVFGGDAIGLIIAGWLEGLWPDAREYARPIGIGTAVGLITAAQVIFGELIPKRLALTNPEGIAAAVAALVVGALVVFAVDAGRNGPVGGVALAGAVDAGEDFAGVLGGAVATLVAGGEKGQRGDAGDGEIFHWNSLPMD